MSRCRWGEKIGDSQEGRERVSEREREREREREIITVSLTLLWQAHVR